MPPTQTPSPLHEALSRVAREAGRASLDQADALGSWVGQIRSGNRSWPTHHAVLKSSLDNTLKVANSVYHAAQSLRKRK